MMIGEKAADLIKEDHSRIRSEDENSIQNLGWEEEEM